jgi:hypothetical protein
MIMTVFRDVAPGMEAVSTTETSVNLYHTALCNIPEDRSYLLSQRVCPQATRTDKSIPNLLMTNQVNASQSEQASQTQLKQSKCCPPFIQPNVRYHVQESLLLSRNKHH